MPDNGMTNIPAIIGFDELDFAFPTTMSRSEQS